MPFKNLIRSFREARHNAAEVATLGSKTLLQDPTILAYPVFASLFFVISFPLVNALIVSIWAKLAHFSWLASAGGNGTVPHSLRVAVGLVTFSYFYTSFITVYFTCAVSAAVEAKMDNHPVTFLHGLEAIWHKFGRVSRFAFLSIFFMPLAIIAQRKKLRKEFIWVVGSSFSIHSAQLAPAILNKRTGVGATIRDSINTLGKAWHEGLIFKVATYIILIILSSLSFLPKLVEKYWFSGSSAHWAGWLASALLFTTFWVTTKVFSAVFITALYHQVRENPKKYQ